MAPAKADETDATAAAAAKAGKAGDQPTYLLQAVSNQKGPLKCTVN